MSTESQKISKWLGIISLIPTVALSFMDQTILPVALPTIEKEFGASYAALQWSINAYLLATAVFVLVGGKLGDRIGHKKMFLTGTFIFTLFSVLSGMSPSIEWLIGARAFQGLGSALTFPSQSAIISSLFSKEERGKATGMIVSIGSLFMTLGTGQK